MSTEIPLWTADGSELAAEIDLPDAGPVRIGFIKRHADGSFDIGDFLRLPDGAVAMPAGCDF